MEEYHKIQTVFKRDPDNKFKTLLEGQFATSEFDYLENSEWIFTEKIDGTNIRVMFNKVKKFVTFGGKTDSAQIPAFLMTKLMETFGPDKMDKAFPDDDVCLYGEGYGAKIQKGGGNYIPDGCSFILFDVKVGNWWLRREDVEEIADKLEIQAVPIVGHGCLLEAVAETRYPQPSKIGTGMREGLVMRPKVDLFDRAGKRIIAKIKYKDFPVDSIK